MAKRLNPAVLGGFVLGGIALLIAALFLFGGGELFAEKVPWVTYFKGSVGGLTDGAPVTFRGVPVGKVTKVEVAVNVQDLTAEIPVYFEIDRSRISWIGGTGARIDPQKIIEAGLRAKLSMQSFVTGQMMVELDVEPNTPGHVVGLDKKTPELPSVESEMDVLKQQLTELPIKQLIADADKALNDIDRLLQSPDVGRALKELADTLAETRQLVAKVNQQSGPLLGDLTDAAKQSEQTLAQATETLRSMQTQSSSTLADIRKLSGSAGQSLGDLRTTLKTADAALEQARETLASLNGLVAQDTTTRSDIEGTLSNLNRATSALRGFAYTLERNPNAVIVGK